MRPEVRHTGRLAISLAVMAVWACGTTDQDRPERTDRERDSLIAQSQLPGAAGVGAALHAQDRANTTNATLDSIANSRP